ncbi:unnamed protein product [Clavelina lepadiformis]|uniref:Nbr1 FW domain-containing protein n=1 Tax=Clavelina lepadiformis TaxID=159417 RepID=A0ABP0FLU1_CLALP
MDDTGGDMDIDQCLIGKFSSMGTTDKDVLIGEFRKLLGFQLNSAGCEFFLDMTNWNLHAAIGAYYDFEMPTMKTPSMSFVRDITIGEGEAVPPDTSFIKTWRIQNTGGEKWPIGCTLRFVNGDRMGSPEWVAVADLPPNETLDVSVKMISPATPGIYQGQWRIYTRNMIPFGDIIWVIISVEAGGLLGVTQQMSQFASGLGSPERGPFDAQMDTNPFAVGNNQNNSNVLSCNATDLAFGQSENSFRPLAIDSLNNQPSLKFQTNCSASDEAEKMGTEDNTSFSRRLTASPVLDSMLLKHDMEPSPTVSCWNTKSPTISSRCEDLTGPSHALHRIEEEAKMVANSYNNDGPKFLASCSSYDINARQASPFNSPSKLRELEESFNSPDAPSPIRPSRDLMVNFEEPPKAVHRLDFSSGS